MSNNGWASNIRWCYTVLSPNIAGVPGEILYLFLVLIFYPRWPIFKLIIVIIALSVVAKLLGYSFSGVIRLWNRWAWGKTRPVYSISRNLNRISNGI